MMFTIPVQTTVKVFPLGFKYDSVRFLSVCNPLRAKQLISSESKRAAKTIAKIMSGTKRITKKPDQYHPSKQLAEFGFMKKGLSQTGHRPVSGRVMRRVDMLNNLFVEQITSLLATGEVAPEFLGLGIQISKVKVKSDFSAVNVYWYASGGKKDEIIEQLLSKSSGHLRHLLTQLRVIGVVPPIRFYKDTTFSKLIEVETLLSQFNVSETSPVGYIDNTTCANDITSEGTSVNFNTTTEDRQEFEVESEMSHGILNVNHDRIMTRIKTSVQRQSEKKRARELHLSNISSVNAECDASDVNEIGTGGSLLQEEVQNYRKRQSEFLKYLKQQQAEKSKALKRQSVEEYDKDFYNSMLEERRADQLQNRLEEIYDASDNNDFEDEQFYEEQQVHYENLRENFK